MKLYQCLLVLILALTAPLLAQTNNQGNKPLDPNKWKELKEGIVYKEKEKKIQEKKTKAIDPKQIQNFEQILKILGFLVLGVLLVAVLYYLLKEVLSKGSNKKVGGINFETIEDDIIAADLDAALDQTLQDQSYRDAIRLSFLMILKELSLKNIITHQRDKTNSIYSSEIAYRKPEVQSDFRETSRIFERAWYSDTHITEAMYHYAKLRFDQYIATIQKITVLNG
jgi:hypothetical protein